MNVYNINITDLAKHDIRETASYIKNELKEPILAEKFAEQIIDAIFTLEHMPTRINLVNDIQLAEKQIRCMYIKNYTTFFRIDEAKKIVEIIRVLYSRRN